MNEDTDRFKQLKERIIANIDLSRDVSDDEIKEIISDTITGMKRESFVSLKEREQLQKQLFHEVRRLGILEELISDSSVTEIMVNGTEAVFVEKDGHLYKWDRNFETEEKLKDVIQQIVAKSNRVVNESSPIVDARLENGSRVNVVMNPIALNGPILTIRRFPDDPIRMTDLINFGSITVEAAEFIRKLVISGYNIFVSGGTGSGKTTFLNAMSEFIPCDERVITIEDSAELQIKGVENLVRMETRNANVEGAVQITIRDLIKSSLRMRPDRIVVGEIRDGAALDFLSAANTGHDGSLSTGHANSAADMLTRIETMVLMAMDLPLSAIRRQIASAVDIIIHLGRLRDKTRKVLEISEITGFCDGEITLNPVYQFVENTGKSGKKVEGSLIKKGELKHIEKLQKKGFR